MIMFKKTLAKHTRKRIIVAAGLILVGVIGIVALLQIFAATSQLVLVSDKTSVKKDETFTVTVGINSGGERVTTAEAYITFDPALVSYVSSDYSTATLTAETPNANVGTNYVMMSRYTSSPVTSNIVVGKVTFKAIADSGTIPITVDMAKSSVYSVENLGENVLTGATNASIAIQQADPDPVPSESAQFTLSSSSGSVLKDAAFEVTVGINNHSTPISIGSAYITYDPTKLQYVSTDYSGSSFTDNTPDNSSGNGYVLLSRYSSTPAVNNIVIGKIQFKALVGTGSAAVGIDLGESHIYSATTGSSISDGTNTLSVALTTPPITSPDETDPDPNPNPNPNPTPNPAPTPVNQGTPVKPASPTKTSTGSTVKKTDYYLNGNYVGTNNPGSQDVTIDTSKLDPGDYELTTTTTDENGSTEESKQSFSILSASFLRSISGPVAIGLAIALAVLAFFVFKRLYKRAAPFYKTIH